MYNHYFKSIACVTTCALTLSLLTVTTNPCSHVSAYNNQSTPSVTSGSAIGTSANPSTLAAIETPAPLPDTTPVSQNIYINDILTVSKSKLIAAPGTVHYLTYNASSTPCIKSTSKKTAVAQLCKGKLKITIPATAQKGAYAKITLAIGTTKKQIKVYVQNKIKKIVPTKKKLSLKWKKTEKVVLKLRSENMKKKTTDSIAITANPKSVLKITKIKNTTRKTTFNVRGTKKGTAKISVKYGSKKAKIKVRIK